MVEIVISAGQFAHKLVASTATATQHNPAQPQAIALKLVQHPGIKPVAGNRC